MNDDVTEPATVAVPSETGQSGRKLRIEYESARSGPGLGVVMARGLRRMWGAGRFLLRRVVKWTLLIGIPVAVAAGVFTYYESQARQAEWRKKEQAEAAARAAREAEWTELAKVKSWPRDGLVHHPELEVWLLTRLRAAEYGRLVLDYRVTIQGKRSYWEWDPTKGQLVGHTLPPTDGGLQAVEYSPGNCNIYYPHSFTREQITVTLPVVASHFESNRPSATWGEALKVFGKQWDDYMDLGNNPFNALASPLAVSLCDIDGFRILELPIWSATRKTGWDGQLEVLSSEGEIPIGDRETYKRIKAWQIGSRLGSKTTVK